MLAVICWVDAVAPRLAPADWRLARLRDAAVGLARSSREYGLSLMFVSKTPARLHPSLYTDNRMSFYGSGLSSGAEVTAMSEVIQSGFAGLYRALVGPRADGEAHEPHPFMTDGLAARLSTTEEPVYFTSVAPPAQGGSGG